MQQKKVPMRMCIACREMKEKKALIRIVRTPEGEICLDKKGKVSGRGAYICPDVKCIAKLKKQKLINKVFSMPVSDEVYARIESEFANGKE